MLNRRLIMRGLAFLGFDFAVHAGSGREPGAIALQKPASIGELVYLMDAYYRVNREMSREKYDRVCERNNGRMFPGKAGIYHSDSRQYEPMLKLPNSFQYCYEVEAVSSEEAFNQKFAAFQSRRARALEAPGHPQPRVPR